MKAICRQAWNAAGVAVLLMQFENSGQFGSACRGSEAVFVPSTGIAVVSAATCAFATGAAGLAPAGAASCAKAFVEPAINMQAVTIPNAGPNLMLVSSVVHETHRHTG